MVDQTLGFNRLFLDEDGQLVYDPTITPVERAYLRTDLVRSKFDVVLFLFKNDDAFVSVLDKWNKSTNRYVFSARD